MSVWFLTLMMSLTQLRKNLFQIFRLFKEPGFELEVYHNGKVYMLYAVPLDKPVAATYRPRKKTAAFVSFGDCPRCGEVLANGICMNPECPAQGVE